MSDSQNQNPANNGPETKGGVSRSGFLRDFRPDQHEVVPPGQFKQFSPAGGQGGAPSSGLLKQYSPAASRQENTLPPAWVPPQKTPTSLPAGPTPGQRQLGFLASTMQKVRNFSGKVVAVNRASYEPPPPPMALYRAQIPEMGEVRTKVKPWRRSHALKMWMRARQRRTRLQRTQPNGQRVAISLLFASLLLLVILGSSTSAYAYTFYQSQQPQVESIAQKQVSQVSRFYDRNGVLLGDVYDSNGDGRRTYVDIDYIPLVMRDAMVAAENRTFWEDSGVDPGGIARATLDFFTHGFKAQQGASTLTQQLVKNVTKNAEVNLDRKVTEAFLAVGLTNQFPKAKILEMYLNIAPFGTVRLGVETAAQEYFGLTRSCNQDFAKGIFVCTPAIAQLDYDPVKKTHDPILALARATFLASLPQDPAHYDPFAWPYYGDVNYKQIVLERQQHVLDAMIETNKLVKGLGPQGQAGPITPAIKQRVETITQKMTFKGYRSNWKAPHFMHWAIAQVELALGNGDMTQGAVILQNGGYNIRTTIDINLENYVERVIKHQLDDVTHQWFLPTPYAVLSRDYGVGDAASMVMNAKTGEVLAMAGSKDYDNKAKDPHVAGNYNVATGNDGKDIGRQPASSFKPIVYATAFEMGWYPGIVLPSTRTYFPNGMPSGTPIERAWTPNDYGNKPSNQVLPLRYQLANSFNIPASKAFAFAGIQNVYNTAVRMGLNGIAKKAAPCFEKKADLGECGLKMATALGSNEVPLNEMVGAYQIFANQGARVPEQSILDIWDNYGNHLYHFDPAKVQKVQVLSPQVAYMITAMLSDEDARKIEFVNDHDLSFWSWEGSCTAKINRPYPDCQEQQVAAKTGTSERFVDNLTMGYTPDVVVGTWAGNANGNPMAENVVGITGAAPIWNAIISRLSGKPCNDADGVTCGPLDLNKLGLGGQGVFTNPGGLNIKCVSGSDGLMGYSGNNCDFIIPGQEPLQAGVYSTQPNKPGGGKKK